MKILFRAYFHQKIFRKKLAKNLLGSGSGSRNRNGSRSGHFQKSDPDPDPDPQHCRHVTRLQSGIPVVSIVVVSSAEVSIAVLVVSIAEPHHVMRLQCFRFCIFAKFLLAFCEKSLQKVFVFAKTFHSECGSGFRNQLNVHPYPKHWWMKSKTI
jgi:hypothetical protein